MDNIEEIDRELSEKGITDIMGFMEEDMRMEEDLVSLAEVCFETIKKQIETEEFYEVVLQRQVSVSEVYNALSKDINLVGEAVQDIHQKIVTGGHIGRKTYEWFMKAKFQLMLMHKMMYYLNSGHYILYNTVSDLAKSTCDYNPLT